MHLCKDFTSNKEVEEMIMSKKIPMQLLLGLVRGHFIVEINESTIFHPT